MLRVLPYTEGTDLILRVLPCTEGTDLILRVLPYTEGTDLILRVLDCIVTILFGVYLVLWLSYLVL
jgi:hypothetical protein